MYTSLYSHCTHTHPELMHHKQVGTTMSAQPHKQMHFVQHLFPISTGLYIWNTHLQHTAPQHLNASIPRVFTLSLSDRNFNTSFYKLKTMMQTKWPEATLKCVMQQGTKRPRSPTIGFLILKAHCCFMDTGQGLATFTQEYKNCIV